MEVVPLLLTATDLEKAEVSPPLRKIDIAPVASTYY
jgi:hypothetical protein